ncbi:MAG: hypothetical protein RL418_358, partial [Actinomycetota bacterium]
KERFARSRTGYSAKDVGNLLKRVWVKRGMIVTPDTFEIRTISLGRSGSGFDREQVDEFLAKLVSAALTQQALS